jgi:hypothetical protein
MRHWLSVVTSLVLLSVGGIGNALAMPSLTQTDQAPIAETKNSGQTKLAQAPPVSPAPASPAQATAPADTDEPIGNVATLTGSATVTRNNTATPLKLQDDIFLNDVVKTSANSTLGITFNDATTFNLTANATITIDNYIYQDGGKQNAALFNIAKGTVAFVAAEVAHTGDMKISTPTATLGIRGTTGLVEVPEGAAANNPNNVAIKLYPDADGRVGRIEVNDRAGARLGLLTQGSSGFTIRPSVGGARFAAVPLAISPQQALRDQGIVRQVHAAQSVGRRIVSQQRALRQANPNRNNSNRNNTNPRNNNPNPRNNNPAGAPGQQRQNNNLPARPGTPQAPGTPGRQGQVPPQPGAQPGTQRAGPPQPGVQRPGLQRPGFANRPSPLRRAAPAPRGRQPKERRY